MKNIQIIEGSKNSVFEIYEVPNNIFAKVFPNGADVAFLEDVEHVLTVPEWGRLYQKQLDKKKVSGIHGTLHLTTSPCEKEYFPTRKEAEVL